MAGERFLTIAGTHPHHLLATCGTARAAQQSMQRREQNPNRALNTPVGHPLVRALALHGVSRRGGKPLGVTP